MTSLQYPDAAQAYPLSWPRGRPRTPAADRKRAPFQERSGRGGFVKIIKHLLRFDGGCKSRIGRHHRSTIDNPRDSLVDASFGPNRPVQVRVDLLKRLERRRDALLYLENGSLAGSHIDQGCRNK